MKSIILGLMTVLVFTGIVADAKGLGDILRSRYTCVAETAFDGSFVGKGLTESEARANAKNACIDSGVSWVHCSRIKCEKNF
ncbi:MAG: hypothetical protein EOP04_25790 [Proteobacteria bacterium]|nr:MAG: hypothetical protein EOP04_25790 [Pseudomonadota bacterium]